MRKILLLFIALFLFIAHAQEFDFSKEGSHSSNEILKNYIEEKFQDETSQIVSYFYDINNDSKNEIIGIVKSQFFYTLAGYKLFVLQENNSIWESIKNDIFFDNTKNIKIENKKITYYKSVFYKNEKCKAKIKKNKISTNKNFLDFFRNKKAHSIEEITKFSEGHARNELELVDFHAHHQKSVNINYTHLNEKTKHYLEMK